MVTGKVVRFFPFVPEDFCGYRHGPKNPRAKLSENFVKKARKKRQLPMGETAFLSIFPDHSTTNHFRLLPLSSGEIFTIAARQTASGCLRSFTKNSPLSHQKNRCRLLSFHKEKYVQKIFRKNTFPLSFPPAFPDLSRAGTRRHPGRAAYTCR